MTRTPRTSPEQLSRAKVRSFIEAKILDASAKPLHKLHGKTKAEAIGSMSGTIAELGPGTGVNLGYYQPGVKVIAVEPNPNMHRPLLARAAANGVDLEIRTIRGESIDLDDASVDGVVATLVLCGVDDPDAVVREIHRILKPGGRYFFLEHVAAEDGTRLRSIQDIVLRPHRWAANGCETNRETLATIERAGFAKVEHRTVDLGPAGLYNRIHLIGSATR